jgi:N utilization substance protein A
VESRDKEVDPVGACVGMKGMRVQSIIRELRGEKIDIIEYSDDPIAFATHALSPAKISRVSILDANEKHMEVIVDDSQLSLAIGKKGQNVRLAAKLLGWKIDIKSEEEKRQEVESAMAALVPTGAPVSVLIDHGLAENIAEKLIEASVSTVEKLGSMTPEELEAIPGIDPATVETILIAVNSYYAQFEQQPAESAEAAGQEPVESVEIPTEAESGAELAQAPAEVVEPAAESSEVEAATESTEDSAASEKESDTIKDSGEVS